jgi:hypothetical protein
LAGGYARTGAFGFPTTQRQHVAQITVAWRGGVILGLLSIVPLLGVGIFYLETPRLKQQAFADLNGDR